MAAIFGHGIDIVEIERVTKLYDNYGESFSSRILSSHELEDFEQAPDKARFLAKRFAAKEAAAKALGTGFSEGVVFADFVISKDGLGKPILRFLGRALEIVGEGAHAVMSLSDEHHYVVASVIIQKAH